MILHEGNARCSEVCTCTDSHRCIVVPELSPCSDYASSCQASLCYSIVCLATVMIRSQIVIALICGIVAMRYRGVRYFQEASDELSTTGIVHRAAARLGEIEDKGGLSVHRGKPSRLIAGDTVLLWSLLRLGSLSCARLPQSRLPYKLPWL